MLDIRIKTIPQAEQRYETAGDWQDRAIYISDLGDTTKESLVALHELAEKIYCDTHSIPEDGVTQFDIVYEATRESGKAPCGCAHYVEPGDDPHSPYYKAHQIATIIERIMCLECGLDWIAYNTDIEE